MPQTVFDPGDPITSRLRLGVTPDVSTNASISVTRPDGTAIAPGNITMGSFVGSEITAQWFATNDGTQGAAKDAAIGDWLAVWTVTGTGASVSPKIYAVQPLPGAAPSVTYSPFLSEIADFVPWLTLDIATPGGDTFLGTFTGTTWPTDEQVHRITRRVVDPIAARWPDLSSDLSALARSYVAVRVASILAQAYPRVPGDLTEANTWGAHADRLWQQFEGMASDATTSPTATGQVPIFAFPEPPAFGDAYL